MDIIRCMGWISLGVWEGGVWEGVWMGLIIINLLLISKNFYYTRASLFKPQLPLKLAAATAAPDRDLQPRASVLS